MTPKTHLTANEQRVIKFRVWDTKTEKMLSGFHLFGEVTLMGGIHEWQHENLPSDYEKSSLERLNDLVEMQFTGLLDKNGKEIYEGDIIQFKKYFSFIKWWSSVEEIPKIEAEAKKMREDIKLESAKMEFLDGQFCIGYITGKHISRGYMTEKYSNRTSGDIEEKFWDFEIIGNIYENPDLLAIDKETITL